MTSPRKPTAGFWITVALVVVAVYLLGMGPVSWLGKHGYLLEPLSALIYLIYTPIEMLHERGPEPIVKLIDWYIGLWQF